MGLGRVGVPSLWGCLSLSRESLSGGVPVPGALSPSPGGVFAGLTLSHVAEATPPSPSGFAIG